MSIVDIFRAGALRPMAEALWVMGEKKVPALVYEMAPEEGVHDSSSWPRAVSATCLSMVSVDFEPGEARWRRLA